MPVLYWVLRSLASPQRTWAVTGILKHAGIDHFLEGLTKEQVESDYENRQWAQFVQSLYDTFGDEEFTTADIAKLVMIYDAQNKMLPGTADQCNVCESLPDHVAYRGKTEQDFKG